MFPGTEQSLLWPGRLLIIGIATSLLCSATNAHDVSLEKDRATIVHPPANPNNSAKLAPAMKGSKIRQLLRSFRKTGDDQYLDEAWALLEPVLENRVEEPHIFVEAAMVAQSRHEFDKALGLTNRALALNHRNDQAWLLLAAIHLVRGNVDQAQTACKELRMVPALVAITCHARVSIARGENEQTLRRLTALLDAVDKASINPEWLAWSLSVAGDAAFSVDANLAISMYERSLEITESTQVRAALVDVLLTTNQLEHAADCLRAGSNALPLTVRRLIVATRTGREHSVAAEITAADHEFRHWIANEDWSHAREMARFYLDVLERPTLARRLALLNVSLQHEPEDLLLAHRAEDLLVRADY